MSETKETAPKAVAVKPKFTKKELLASKKYRHKQDLVSALLADDATYTLAEVDKKIENYLNKEVK